MADDPHHEHLIKEVAELFDPVLHDSPQAIYIYLDDEHKICNQQFADLLGYGSIQEWVQNMFPVEDILETEREEGIDAFVNASEKLIATTLGATWVKKDGTKVKSEVIMVPFVYKDEVFVIHFITPKV